MEKLLIFVLIIAMLITGAVLFLTQRYKTIATAQGAVLVFDSLTCSFIEKNEKGEWETNGVKEGEAFMSFSGEEKSGNTPSITPKTKPAVKKPELKI